MSSALPAAGILLIDKAAGWTSHDVVAALRPMLGTRRVGHGGTLDPFATGLLPVLYGAATRLVDHLHRAPKAYLAEMVLGAETATDDREGEVIDSAPVPELDDAGLRDVLAGFVGQQEQRPPVYSAIRVRGERAYARARRGESADLAPRRIDVHELLLLERDDRCVHFLVTCSAGTYVRALARDLGRALGTRAHLGALRRIAAGGFFVEDAVEVDHVRALADVGALGTLVHPPDAAVLDLPAIVLARDTARRLLQGQRVAAPAAEDGPRRLYEESGDFLGVGDVADGAVRPRTILHR